MVLAHIGHWYAEIAYVAPVAIVAGWLGISSRLEKRRARDAVSEGSHPPG